MQRSQTRCVHGVERMCERVVDLKMCCAVERVGEVFWGRGGGGGVWRVDERGRRTMLCSEVGRCGCSVVQCGGREENDHTAKSEPRVAGSTPHVSRAALPCSSPQRNH